MFQQVVRTAGACFVLLLEVNPNASMMYGIYSCLLHGWMGQLHGLNVLQLYIYIYASFTHDFGNGSEVVNTTKLLGIGRSIWTRLQVL